MAAFARVDQDKQKPILCVQSRDKPRDTRARESCCSRAPLAPPECARQYQTTTRGNSIEVRVLPESHIPMKPGGGCSVYEEDLFDPIDHGTTRVLLQAL